jgi:hypothetical protein
MAVRIRYRGAQQSVLNVSEYGQSINPISRLIQIQQAKKEKEPVYTLIAEKGMPRRREFVMQVRLLFFLVTKPTLPKLLGVLLKLHGVPFIGRFYSKKEQNLVK